MAYNRRSFLAAGLGLGASAGLSSLAVFAGSKPVSAREVRQKRFVEMRPVMAQLKAGKQPTEIWKYLIDGQGPNDWPVLRADLGAELAVQIANHLVSDTSIHWHGIRLPNKLDGVDKYSQFDAAYASDDISFSFPLKDPGTYWMHSHRRSWEQVARGLYGMVIVSNPNEPNLYDVPLVLDDWPINSRGEFDESQLGNLHDWAHAGTISDFLTVNGKTKARIKTPNYGWVRFRLLNASTSSYQTPRFTRGFDARLIALDGFGIKPVSLHDAVVLGPGQRADVIVNLDDIGKRSLELKDGRKTLAVFEPTFGLLTEHGARVPSAFRAYEPRALAPARRARTRSSLTLQGGAMGRMRSALLDGKPANFRTLARSGKVWAFNGRTDWESDPLFEVGLGQTHSLKIKNETAFAHAIHLHGQHFKILQNKGLPSEEGRMRDTVNVASGDEVEIALKGAEKGQWLIHCHMLGHQASGMIASFVIA